MLGVGRVLLSGTAPSRQNSFADLRRIWLIEGSTAIVDGVDFDADGCSRLLEGSPGLTIATPDR